MLTAVCFIRKAYSIAYSCKNKLPTTTSESDFEEVSKGSSSVVHHRHLMKLILMAMLEK